MIAVIQRVNKASVEIENAQVSRINKGLCVLLGVGSNDSFEDADWLSQKIIQMRIFGDETNKMNLSLQDINGELLVVSQFTLFANIKKGNRPSFIDAAKPELAIPLYTYFIEKCTSLLNREIQTGQFGADMKIDLVNDGPVTIIADSKQRI